MKLHHLLLALLALALASLACGTSAENPGATDTQPSSPTREQPVPEASITPTQRASVVEIPTMSSQGAGMACLATRSGGLSCLDENGWKTYTKENSGLPNTHIHATAACPNGNLALAHYSGVSIFDGTNWSHISQPPSPGALDHLICMDKNVVWIAQFKNISRYQNGAWTTFPVKGLASGTASSDLVYGLEAGLHSNFWALQPNSLALYSDNIWTTYQPGNGWDEEYFFSALYTDELGNPWAAHSRGILTFQNNEWKALEYGNVSSPKHLAIDAGGSIWVGTLNDGMMVYQDGLWKSHNVASGALSSDSIRALTTDHMGRVWVGTTYGLSVFDGASWLTYRMDNAGIADNEIVSIIVVKDGPPLPSPLEPKAGSSITGKLEKADGSPLADKTVEICIEPVMLMTRKTPCEGQAFIRSTTTDPQGVFVFEDVPTGYYVLSAETDDGWARFSERTFIPPGETYDMGSLQLKEP